MEVKSEFGTLGPRPEVEKKTYNGGRIITGVIIFVVLFTFPLWYTMGRAVKAPEPKIDTPVIQKLPEKERKCIESKAYMRANHMQMLEDWRNTVVREAGRDYINFDGKRYTASLQNTCLECHSNYSKFCDECHKYMGITPYCWGCHLQLEEKPEEEK